MHAVGADHKIGADRFANLKAQFHRVRRLRKTDAFTVEANRIRFCFEHGLGDDAMQIAAMNGDVGKTVAFARFHAEIEQLPALPGVPQPDRLAGRQHLYFLQSVLEPERVQNPGAVGADLYAGAKLAQFRRLLVDVDLDAAAQKCQRRRKPADTAADDGDLAFVHGGASRIHSRCGTRTRKGKAMQSNCRDVSIPSPRTRGRGLRHCETRGAEAVQSSLTAIASHLGLLRLRSQ